MFAYEGIQDNNADDDQDQNDHQSVEPIDTPINDVVIDHQPTLVDITSLDTPKTFCKRSIREKQESTCYSPSKYILLTNMGELEDYDEVMLGTNRDQWVESMEDEIKLLFKNDTFELVELPKDNKALVNK